jgi:NRPS condensation-like uncharacterized protein
MTQTLERTNVEEIVELNRIQEGMLFHHLDEHDGNIYNVQLALDIKGEFDASVCRQALRSLQKRNEALRSVFRWENLSKPIQIILKEWPLDFGTVDFSGEEDALDEVETLLQSVRAERFDLTRPPIRIHLIKISEAFHSLIITHHHVLYDGWSTSILLNEFFSEYQRVHNRLQEGPRKAPSYSLLQTAIRHRASQANSRTYWERTFKNRDKNYCLFPAITDAPSKELGKLSIDFSHSKLAALASQQNVTKASVVFAAIGLVRQNYFDTHDVVIGTTVSIRDTAVKGYEYVIGNFINTVPMVITSSAGMTLGTLIKNVHRDSVERSDNSFTPYSAN